MPLSLFEDWVAEFEERPLPRPTPRDVPLPLLPGKADALVGMRRVGKTWRIYQQLAELLDQGVPKERMLYVNLEDERLVGVEADDLGDDLPAMWPVGAKDRAHLVHQGDGPHAGVHEA